MHIDEVKKEIADNPNGIFLISGCGRSGTKSCAEYLGGVHEPRGLDWRYEEDMWRNTHRGGIYADKYVISDLRDRPKPYIEVNSAIAPICKRIAQALPEAKIYHIKRKKEDVINSIMKRENYTPESEPRNSPEPNGGFPKDFTRRDKISWFVDQYYKFMEGFPVIETETIPIIRNQS